ncbi:MAG: Emfourin [Nocardioidaceae bacterium]|nr:Emfourin [Nocardioidaceae bacterium]
MGEGRVRVEVTRSGGVTGIGRSAVADSGELDVAGATELVRLVDECSFGEADASSAVGVSTSGADRFQYDVTVQRGDQVLSFVRSEPELTPAEQQLLRWVLSRP